VRGLFGMKKDAASQVILKPGQLYVLFTDLSVPVPHSQDFIEEMTRFARPSTPPKSIATPTQSIKLPAGPRTTSPPTSPQQPKAVVTRVKECLKSFLLASASVQSLAFSTADPMLPLPRILSLLREDLFKTDGKRPKQVVRLEHLLTPAQIDEKHRPLSVTTTANYVIGLLRDLDETYVKDGYAALYHEMLQESQKRLDYLTHLSFTFKTRLIRGMEVLKQSDNQLLENLDKLKRQRKSNLVYRFMQEVRFSVCVMTQEMRLQFIKNPTESDKNNKKITITKQFSCPHEPPVMGSLTQKPKPASHVDTIYEFIDFFGAIPEVRESIITGNDTHGINESLSYYMESIFEAARGYEHFKSIKQNDFRFIFEEIEKSISSRLHPKYMACASID
jgi:hypothetical protein